MICRWREQATPNCWLAAVHAICDEFEAYGWRRVQAALRHRGIIANHKRIKRLMREHDLQPRRRRRYIATTDSDHDQPIFPDVSKDLILDGPDQLWVADITYVPIVGGFVYVAIILDAWSRRVVGYAIGRSIEARLAIAALKVAIARRNPQPGLVHHSDRGSQYASVIYKDLLAAHGIIGSMSRRGNPYDKEKASCCTLFGWRNNNKRGLPAPVPAPSPLDQGGGIDRFVEATMLVAIEATAQQA